MKTISFEFGLCGFGVRFRGEMPTVELGVIRVSYYRGSLFERVHGLWKEMADALADLRGERGL